MGLDVPQVNRVILALRDMGLDRSTPAIFTVEQAVQAADPRCRREAPHA